MHSPQARAAFPFPILGLLIFCPPHSSFYLLAPGTPVSAFGRVISKRARFSSWSAVGLFGYPCWWKYTRSGIKPEVRAFGQLLEPLGMSSSLDEVG